MGRVKTQLIKRTGTELYAKHPGNFSNDFEQNKQKVRDTAQIPSKKMRNSIIGYLTRLVRKQKQL